MRSHYCGDINSSDIDSNIEISGWVHKRRDHGGVIFLDVRDLHGIVQVVFNPNLKSLLFNNLIPYGNIRCLTEIILFSY